MSTLTPEAPFVVSLGPDLPWLPPQDFAELTPEFQPDSQWRALVRNLHYTRTDALMRSHLRRWANEHGMDYEARRLRSFSDLAIIDRDGSIRQKIAEDNVILPTNGPLGLLIRFTPARVAADRLADDIAIAA